MAGWPRIVVQTRERWLGETAEALPDDDEIRIGLKLEHRDWIGAARGELALEGEEFVRTG
jgi:hypothetical protein